MCHGYEMRWWKGENTAKEKAKETRSEVIRSLAAQQQEEPGAVSADTVEEKKLVPAE